MSQPYLVTAQLYAIVAYVLRQFAIKLSLDAHVD